MSAARSRSRRKQIDPAVVVLGILVVAALPVLGFAAYKLLLKPPKVIVETQVVKLPPVEKPKPDQPSTAPENSTALADARPTHSPRSSTRSSSGDMSSGSRKTRPASTHAPAGEGPPSVATALHRIGQDAADALGLGKKVLVIWLFDESASAAALRREVADQLSDFYGTLAGAESAEARTKTGDEAPVLSVVGGFAGEVKFPTEEPVADASQVSAAATGLKQSSDHLEKPFAAIRAAIEKFGDYRVKKQRFLTIVLVTDEAGDDEAQIDEVLPLLERYSVPVNCVGVTAPFGKMEGQDIHSEGKPTDARDVRVRQGPESRYPEWIHLDYPSGRDDSELSLNTELGPYSLTRLCKESGGNYFSISSGGNFDWGGGSGRRGNWQGRQSASALPRAYAPQYLPEKVIQAQLQQNKAKKALVEAAMLPQAGSLNPRTVTVDSTDEVKKQRALAELQKPAAKLLPGIDKLLDTLRAGESDEPKLTEPRWKAGYDLALGRALAAKARCQGFDDMVATLKTDKMKNPKSTEWVLEPSDEPTGISVDDKMAAKARDYLNRVIKEHPGTPWASSAARELETPIGWKKMDR